MIVLGLDTCLGACSVALTEDDITLCARSEPMRRGHQERLAPMVRQVMEDARIAFSALDRIAVTVGPGSFTGLRVGLAFAKGLAAALDRPCVGVGCLPALAASVADRGFLVAAIDAGRGRIFVQMFDGAIALMAPDSLAVDVAWARIAELGAGRDGILAGPGAPLLAGAAPAARLMAIAAPRAEIVAALARRAQATPPRPLYLRAPDATPKAA